MSAFRVLRRGLIAAGALPLLAAPGAAHAAAAGTVDGLIVAGNGSSTVSFYSAQGAKLTSPAPISQAVDPVWFPDGRRVAYAVPGGGISTMDPYTRSVIALTKPPSGYYDTDPSVDLQGETVDFVRVATKTGFGTVYIIATNGSYRQVAEPLFTGSTAKPDDGGIAESGLAQVSGNIQGPYFVRGANIVKPVLVTSPDGETSNWQFPMVVADAAQPDTAPDDRGLAFIRKDTSGVPQLWVAQADGSNPVQVTTGSAGAQAPRWSSTGDELTYTTTAGQLETFEVALPGGYSAGPFAAPVRLGSGVLEYANWQPLNPGYGVVDRIAGSNAIGTAIAASQHNWADVGATGSPIGDDPQGRIAAQAVVLSRSDAYYDALAGSAFATDAMAPLLLTPTDHLDPGVQAEIQRILPAGGKVYLLGGDAALSAAVQDQIAALGYDVVRFAGADMYDTAILVDKAIPHSPSNFAFVATGENYYDALAAGAAAGLYSFGGTPIVLTQGTKMPAVSAAYLKSLIKNGVAPEVIGVGGPGYAAMENAISSGQLKWPANYAVVPFVGSNAIQTALDFVGYSEGQEYGTAALATTSGWYDALSGGSMAAIDAGPLLLTPPNKLDPSVAAYLQANNGTITSLDILGGTQALSPAVFDSAENLIALPDSLGGTVPIDFGNAARTAARLTAPGAPLQAPARR